MQLPDSVNSRWIASLSDKQLQEAERLLHAEFLQHETVEKASAGARYKLMHGPQALVSAWHRWMLVNNESHSRNVVIRRKPRQRARAT